MKTSKRLIGFAAAAVIVLGFSFKEDLFQVSKNLDIFAALYKEININYVEETNPSTLMKTGIDVMLEDLDPYTEYIPESEIEDYKLKYVSTQYGGIGAGTLFIDGRLYVNDVLENFPSNKQDVRPGDEIIKINDIEVKGKDRLQVSQLLRGPKGSPVPLVISRDGVLITKSLVREEILQPNVSYSGMVGDKIGYIKLDKFLENSGQEVKDALVNINKNQPKGIILDLRNNGGGILQEAVKIVNLFVNKDQLIVDQRGRNAAKTVSYKTLAQPVSPQIPLVVLVNSGSASASEIVAGSLQDLDRAVIIGQRSYGKGLVQQTFNLPYNSLVKITVAKYYTPSGRCIQALDYAHKNEDGAATKFADSLITVFNTKAGRTVYNGNGVYPDVVTTSAKLSPVATNVLTKSLYFNFANSYKKQNKTIPQALQFKLTDADYNNFIGGLSPKELTFTSGSDRLLTELNDQAEKEGRLDEIKPELEALRSKLSVSGKAALLKNKEEVRKILETQVVLRYYFDKGRVEQAFQYDKEIAEADALFNNPAKINAILTGQGSYKTIGTPGHK